MRVRMGTGLSTSRDVSAEHDKARWSAICRVLRGEERPHAHALFGALYQMAQREATRCLRPREGRRHERAEDLASQVLVDALTAIVAADDPRAYFRTAVKNRACSWARSPRSRVDSVSDHGWDEVLRGGHPDDEELRAIYRIDDRAALEKTSARARVALIADAVGFGRDEIAAALDTSRANVDQLISRSRRNLA